MWNEKKQLEWQEKTWLPDIQATSSLHLLGY